MRAGNKAYRSQKDVPETVPVFPLTGALLLPGGHMPLNIFEPRYLQMVDDAMASGRVIGMIQPRFDLLTDDQTPEVCSVGCLGRITSFNETGDGRYVIGLTGICRFRTADEVTSRTPYRVFSIKPFLTDLDSGTAAEKINRPALLAAFKAYLDANDMEADWDSVRNASDESLVNALSMMSPYGPAEKQALLEAPDLRARAETLIAITEIHLARESEDDGPVLQ